MPNGCENWEPLEAEFFQEYGVFLAHQAAEQHRQEFEGWLSVRSGIDLPVGHPYKDGWLEVELKVTKDEDVGET